MKKSDHLRVCFGWYQHHGIYIGNDQVIHFGRGLHDLENAKVETVTLRSFANGGRVEVVDSNKEFDADEIVARAKSKLDATEYDLFENNCEHFATWCRSGISRSPQIEASESVARQATAMATKPLLKRLLANKISKAAASKLAFRCSTRVTGTAIVGDATQTAAELVALSMGKEQRQARKIGFRTGAATSALLGTAIGGPIGGASTLGLWLVGQLVADQTIEKGKRTFNYASRNLTRRNVV